MEKSPNIEKLIKLAKKNGLKKLKIGNIELEFNDENSVVTSKSNDAHGKPLESIPLAAASERQPSEDELLYLSTPYYDDLLNQRDQARKEPA